MHFCLTCFHFQMLKFFCKQIQRRSTNFQARCSRLFKVSLQQYLDKFWIFHSIFLLNFNPYKTKVSDSARSYLNQNSLLLGRLRFLTLIQKGRLSDELIIVPILHDRRILTSGVLKNLLQRKPNLIFIVTSPSLDIKLFKDYLNFLSSK